MDEVQKKWTAKRIAAVALFCLGMTVLVVVAVILATNPASAKASSFGLTGGGLCSPCSPPPSTSPSSTGTGPAITGGGIVSPLPTSDPSLPAVQTTPNYRCPPCVAVVAGLAGEEAIMLGGAAVAGAAGVLITQATVHEPAATVVQSKPSSPKAQRLKGWARAWKVNGKAIWRASGKTAWGVWRFFKARFGVAHLIAQFPNAAAGCVTAALVTVAVGDTVVNALKACIGAAAGVYATT